MTEVSVSSDFDQPASVVWTIIADFCGINRWLPGIERVEAEERGKRRRIILPDGGIVLEEEIGRDEVAMSLTYVVISAPMPFNNYRSTMRVEPRGNGCTLHWSASFNPNGPEDKVARLVGSLYRAGINGLKLIVELTVDQSVQTQSENR